MPELDQFAQDLHQEVLVKCAEDASLQLREDAFTECVLERLAEHNEADNAEMICPSLRWESRGRFPATKINAWALSGDGAVNLYSENQILFSTRQDWRFLLTAVSGMVVPTIAKSQSAIVRSGKRNSLRTRPATAALIESCASSAGESFGFGNTASPSVAGHAFGRFKPLQTHRLRRPDNRRRPSVSRFAGTWDRCCSQNSEKPTGRPVWSSLPLCR